MARDVRELVAFIASPSDLEAEREAIRNLQTELNAMFENHGVRLSISGWEHVQPDLGRPQGLINPMVDTCDIFIGMLKRRYGSPSGVADSGFEEEFDIAYARRLEGDTPSVALFFADLEPYEYEDPGEGTKRVLAFKLKVRQEFTAMYKSFSSTEDLIAKVKDIFTRAMLNAALPIQVGAREEGSAGSARNPQPVDATKTGAGREDIGGSRRQVADVLDGFLSVVQGGPRRGNPDGDRLALIAIALSPDEGPLATHLTNRLYQRRDELELGPGEAGRWLWTLLEDIGRNPDPNNRVIPGWGALYDDENDLVSTLVKHAGGDNGYVATGAMETLTRAQFRPPDLWTPAPHDEPTDTTNEQRVENWVKVINADGGQGPAVGYLLHGVIASQPGERTTSTACRTARTTHVPNPNQPPRGQHPARSRGLVRRRPESARSAIQLPGHHLRSRRPDCHANRQR